jgi:hypothetical protein
MRKSRQEFIDHFADQVSGLLLSAFGEAWTADEGAKGKWMLKKLRQARTLLDEMYTELEPVKEAKPVANGTAQTQKAR